MTKENLLFRVANDVQDIVLTLAPGISDLRLNSNSQPSTSNVTVFGNNGANQIFGNEGSNTLHGLDGNDFLGGGAGNDFLFGGIDNDTLDGGDGNDRLNGGAGADALDGGAGQDAADYIGSSAGLTVDLLTSSNNTGEAVGDTYVSIENVRGSAFADDLRGDNFNNFLEGGAGADILNGRNGFDYANYQNASAGVTASLANPGVNTGEAAGDTYISIEHLAGSAFDDILTGDAGNNNLRGGAGADVLDGGAGLDTADYLSLGGTTGVTADLGNSANNTGIAAGDTYVSIENLRGTNFADILRGDANINVLEGGAGADVLDGGGTGLDYAAYQTSTTAIVANLGNAGLNTGDAAGDTYIGIRGIFGSNFNDTLTGDGQDNFLRGGLGADALDGGAGDDTADYQGSISGLTVNLANAALNTGEAAGDTFVSIERIRGSNFNDTLVGDGQNNFLRGGLGADVLDGGAGDDWADYFTATAGLTVNLANAALNTGEAAGDTFVSMERIRGSNFNDTLTGDAQSNFLRGGLGADALDGGAGSDWADYHGSTSGVTVNLANAALNTGEAAGDTFVSIERVRGSDFNDSLVGDAQSNFLRGGLGADALDGGAGSDVADYFTSSVGLTVDLLTASNNTGEAAGDTYVSIENLRGSAFADDLRGDNVGNFLEGGEGADILNGRGGGDFATYQNATSSVTASLANATVNTGEAAGDTFISIEHLAGSAFDDVLTGDANHNFLRGNAGADVLDGGAGFDTADYGGLGTTSGVTADLGNSANNTGNAAGDTYISIENLRGSNFADVLRGDANNNVLDGGAGADILDGGGAGFDFASYQNSATGLTVNLANASLNTGDAAGDSYIGIRTSSVLTSPIR